MRSEEDRRRQKRSEEGRYEGTRKIEEDRGGVRLDGARKNEDEKQ